MVKATQQGWLPTQVSFPFGGVLELGPLIWPLGLWTFLAESNATNLTDGLDGLAAGCGTIILLGMAIQLMLRGNGGDPGGILAGLALLSDSLWALFIMGAVTMAESLSVVLQVGWFKLAAAGGSSPSVYSAWRPYTITLNWVAFLR